MEDVCRKVGPEARVEHGLMRAGFKVDRCGCHAAMLNRLGGTGNVKAVRVALNLYLIAAELGWERRLGEDSGSASPNLRQAELQVCECPVDHGEPNVGR
jgi:hypothetical protein